MEIQNKIKDVDDSVCRTCNQLWEMECRAYTVPHSSAEAAHRKKDLKPKCARLQYGERKFEKTA